MGNFFDDIEKIKAVEEEIRNGSYISEIKTDYDTSVLKEFADDLEKRFNKKLEESNAFNRRMFRVALLTLCFTILAIIVTVILKFFG